MTRPVTVVTVAFAMVAIGSVAFAAGTQFRDVPDDHVFADDIAWMAEQGITRGCNPPTNDEFCPEDPVTRGQMAAFTHRFAESDAVGDPPRVVRKAPKALPGLKAHRVLKAPSAHRGHRDRKAHRVRLARQVLEPCTSNNRSRS